MMLTLPAGGQGMGGPIDWLQSTGDPRKDALNACKRNISTPLMCTFLGLCADPEYQVAVAQCEGQYVCSGPTVADRAACDKVSSENVALLADTLAADVRNEKNREKACPAGEFSTGLSLFPCASTSLLLMGAAAGLLILTVVMRRR